MGLFDRALKGILSKAEEAVDKVSKSDVMGAAVSEVKGVFNDVQDAFDKLDKVDEIIETETAKYEEAAEGPSGFSWGGLMPEEPNQYNFEGTWQEYFSEVFGDYFPHYEIWCEDTIRGGAIYNFMDGGRKVLCVEVMNEKSEANSFRKKCKAEGIPYVRFYYNHKGWWNTREYVYVRVREALEKK